MTMTTKVEIFTQYIKEYGKASLQRKGAILTITCEVTGMRRKSAIRSFGYSRCLRACGRKGADGR